MFLGNTFSVMLVTFFCGEMPNFAWLTWHDLVGLDLIKKGSLGRVKRIDRLRGSISHVELCTWSKDLPFLQTRGNNYLKI